MMHNLYTNFLCPINSRLCGLQLPVVSSFFYINELAQVPEISDEMDAPAYELYGLN
jgi:hypothetical protein